MRESNTETVDIKQENEWKQPLTCNLPLLSPVPFSNIPIKYNEINLCDNLNKFQLLLNSIYSLIILIFDDINICCRNKLYQWLLDSNHSDNNHSWINQI